MNQRKQPKSGQKHVIIKTPQQADRHRKRLTVAFLYAMLVYASLVFVLVLSHFLLRPTYSRRLDTHSSPDTSSSSFSSSNRDRPSGYVVDQDLPLGDETSCTRFEDAQDVTEEANKSHLDPAVFFLAWFVTWTVAQGWKISRVHHFGIDLWLPVVEPLKAILCLSTISRATPLFAYQWDSCFSAPETLLGNDNQLNVLISFFALAVSLMIIQPWSEKISTRTLVILLHFVYLGFLLLFVTWLGLSLFDLGLVSTFVLTDALTSVLYLIAYLSVCPDKAYLVQKPMVGSLL